ncbi:hypothetical protein BJ684DRAFT_20399 [Piptocephalis cylindrospora]|uniref:Uncharacterized protein n=1 Tax=Piptocephalis cylindrospora TaxID=1907219 RepID=A0A4P9Y346_9FUNG|nr:hypothetical protein BJ684DRAFT_20399 [Piptocephalis cylindrospora]|eukprot:RKP13094.1 hypothetical protein BJ684DRAFT_20399 [Piptocephalis cylindrospora]
MHLVHLILSCLLLLLIDRARSANDKLGLSKVDLKAINSQITNPEDRKSGRFAFRHMGTGFFLSGYVAPDTGSTSEGRLTMVIPTKNYDPRVTKDNGTTVGIWDLAEDLLKKHIAQLLILELNVTTPDKPSEYACAQYSMDSTSPSIQNCLFDRSDKQMQQIMVDLDRANSSVVTIGGNNRKDCFGFSGFTFTGMPCTSANAKWFMYGETDAEPDVE